MMKMLQIKLPNGYKMLEKGFEINFLTKTRVNGKADNDDLIDLGSGLYCPIETIFIGKNSSGKTTVLQLLHTVLSFLGEGRIPSVALQEESSFSFEVIFYALGNIYRYVGTFQKKESLNRNFLTIVSESLQVTVPKKSYKKDLSNAFFPKENLLKGNVGSDTSDIVRFTENDHSSFADPACYGEREILALIASFSELYGEDAFDKVIHLFDDSVESIKPFKENGEKDGFRFKRIHKPERIVSYDYLRNILSAGTFRGIHIFLSSLLAFRLGGTILVDEIERSFNKNLAQNLILLFNDKAINIKNATLVYTTHYAELLDDNRRLDNINVLHRHGDQISLKNLHKDYDLNIQLSKSNYFEQNAFDSLLNYNSLMELRRAILP